MIAGLGQVKALGVLHGQGHFGVGGAVVLQHGDFVLVHGCGGGGIVVGQCPLGDIGQLQILAAATPVYLAYLEMHRPILFNALVLSDKLFEHCAEIDEAARNCMELIARSLAEQNGVTEQLKAENQMEWVRQMNACKAQAEEVAKAELIYN